ncbi:two-component system response regulator BtsR [Rubrivivax gelatinosus]|uniref:LytTR family two component transcriptional regulator n=1 Tax=Rubrivivax gelatinosus TaxID=28068 RepID=A0A4R2MFV4_RUBGE|nr:two-component system response regulator BtsR [Rubrivivax gelatinosus]MBK1686675.1 two-component system response regulator YehT [Rubrivivax gelatinosus]TCP05301.1 LytTR family two component transcriptional regulator [Rubrivivax gelatinosus]
MITALIVDDEPFARRDLCRALEPARDIQILGECGNAIDALTRIHVDKPDVVFLDIQMPQITGIEMIGMLDPETMPHIVFLTAYDEYAVRAFEKNAFDYMLKPVTSDRLELTLERLRNSFFKHDFSVLPEVNHLRQIPCYGLHSVVFVQATDVEFVEARTTGIYVSDLDGHEHPTALRLNILQQRTQLLRCHRQYLVNVDLVHKLQYLESGLAEFVTRRGRVIPISRRLLPEIKERLGIS